MPNSFLLLNSALLILTGSLLMGMDVINLLFTNSEVLTTAGMSFIAIGLGFIGLIERKEGRENIFKAYLGCALGIIIASNLQNWMISTYIGLGLAVGSIYYISVNRLLPELKEKL